MRLEHPCRTVGNFYLNQLRCNTFPRRPHLAYWQARPTGEIIWCCWAVSGEVAECEFSACLISRKSNNLSTLYPIVKEDIRRLSATVRTQADDAFKCGTAYQVWCGLTFQADTVSGELLDDLGPGQCSLIGEYVAHEMDSSAARLFV